jgi:hypothetical protein
MMTKTKKHKMVIAKNKKIEEHCACIVRKWLLRMGASRTKQVSTSVHDERLLRITGSVLK